MSHTKHVSYFVNHHADASPQDTVIVYFIFSLFVKPLVVSRKRKNSSSLLDTCEAKDEVPLISWIQVG